MKLKAINHKSFFQMLILGIVMLVLLAIVARIQYLRVDKLETKNGILDLAEWEKANKKPMFLYGEWNFYWKEFLSLKEIEEGRQPNTLARIPSVWNKYKIPESKITGKGYATYHLRVMNARAGEPIAFRLSPFGTAYKMYINQELVASNGVVGVDEQSAKGKYQMEIFQYTPHLSEFDIIVHVSNFSYARGGFWYAPEIGKVEDIDAKNKAISIRDAFLIGCFILILIDSLFIYAIRRKEKSRLFLGIMCIGAIGRTVVYSSYLITNISFLSSIEFTVRIEYLGLGWMVMLFMQLSNSQFPEIIQKKIRSIAMYYLLLFTCVVIFFPIYYFTQIIYMMEIVCMLAGMYTTLKIGQKALTGNKDALLLSIAGTIYMTCGMHDILIHNNIITGGSTEYQPVGFMIFLACESVVIAKKHMRALEQNERALVQIESLSRKEREIELKFLKSQIKPHFIHNALNAIISVSRTNPDRARGLLVEFSSYLRNCFAFDNLENLVTLEQEIQFVKSYISIEEARFGERLKVCYEIENADIKIPPLILQPLVENAVVHGMRESLAVVEIHIYVKVMEDNIWIGVRDNGVGIAEEKLRKLSEGKGIGNGVGLRNINQRLQKIYATTLRIANLPEGGCDISMSLPQIRGITND